MTTSAGDQRPEGTDAVDVDVDVEVDVATVRKDFPILDQAQDGKRLVFLDSAASSQRPRQVIEAVSGFYQHDYANVHRGVYRLAERSTGRFEAARQRVARFINAASDREVVFTKNATEAINLVAGSWGRGPTSGPATPSCCSPTWSTTPTSCRGTMLAAEKGFEIRWIPVTGDGQLDLADLDRLLDGARLCAMTAMSNVTGALPPIDPSSPRPARPGP